MTPLAHKSDATLPTFTPVDATEFMLAPIAKLPSAANDISAERPNMLMKRRRRLTRRSNR